MTLTQDVLRDGRLPMPGTIGLASDLVGQEPVRLIALVVAQMILVSGPSWLLDRYAAPVAGPLAVKLAGVVVEQSALAITNGAIIMIAYAASQRRRCETGAALHAAVRRFWPMLLVGIVQDLAIDIGDVLPEGAVTRAITWLLTALALAVLLLTVVAGPVCMIEERGPVASLSRGVALTRGNRIRIVGVAICGTFVAIFLALIFGLLLLVLGGVLVALLLVILKLAAVPMPVPALISGASVLGFLGALVPIVLFSLVPMALYLNLRAIEAEREPTAPP